MQNAGTNCLPCQCVCRLFALRFSFLFPLHYFMPEESLRAQHAQLEVTRTDEGPLDHLTLCVFVTTCHEVNVKAESRNMVNTFPYDSIGTK